MSFGGRCATGIYDAGWGGLGDPTQWSSDTDVAPSQTPSQPAGPDQSGFDCYRPMDLSFDVTSNCTDPNFGPDGYLVSKKLESLWKQDKKAHVDPYSETSIKAAVDTIYQMYSSGMMPGESSQDQSYCQSEAMCIEDVLAPGFSAGEGGLEPTELADSNLLWWFINPQLKQAQDVIDFADHLDTLYEVLEGYTEAADAAAAFRNAADNTVETVPTATSTSCVINLPEIVQEA